MAVPSDEVIRQDIADILRDADLASLSSKKVRIQLGEKYDCDLTDRKEKIDRMVMEVISEGLHNEEESKPASKTTTSKPPKAKPPAASSSSKASAAKAVNGKKTAKDSDDESDGDEEMKSDEVKSEADSELDDEDLARKLQEEEQRGGRQTRKRVAQTAGRTKKKAKTKDASAKADKPKRTNKYNEACKLSPQLAAIVGEERLPRCEVVKKMWVIIKERNLYDPKNKQFMLCDDQLLTVFGRKKVRTFGMMKYLKDHISSPGTEVD